jgi:hypothetical protein
MGSRKLRTIRTMVPLCLRMAGWVPGGVHNTKGECDYVLYFIYPSISLSYFLHDNCVDEGRLLCNRPGNYRSRVKLNRFLVTYDDNIIKAYAIHNLYTSHIIEPQDGQKEHALLSWACSPCVRPVGHWVLLQYS